MRAIAEENPDLFVRNFRGFAAYAKYARPKRSAQTQCAVYWGPPGTGKSVAAFSYDRPDCVYSVDPPKERYGAVWWDGYDGQRTVVVDDFYGWLARHLVYRLIDIHPSCRVQDKGGSIPFSSRTVVFTSNIPPWMWWSIGMGAMDRRLEAPIGHVQYIGNVRFPTEQSYLSSDYFVQFRPNWVTNGQAVSNLLVQVPSWKPST